MSDRKLLQQFVDSFARFDDMQAFEGTPTEMLVEQPQQDWDSWRTPTNWRPIHFESNSSLLDPVYARIGNQFPELYERFVLSYRWLEVDLGVIRLFANPSGPDFSGLTEAIFADAIIADVLIPNGYVPFARSPVNYDPICFHLAAMTPETRDCPILQFEHESILCHSRIGEQKVLWKSIRDLVTEVIFSDSG